MEKRWISLLAENEVGVLAGITGLFSGKSYNLNILPQAPRRTLPSTGLPSG